MTTSNPSAVAQALLAARRDRTAIDVTAFAPLIQTTDDAYAVQELVYRASDPSGAFPRFWKAGGPNPGSFTNAPLPLPGVWTSPADARSFHFNGRLVEAEVALRLARDVTPAQAQALTHEAAPALVDAMCVSIEIVDTRWQQRAAVTAVQKLADQQFHGALVLGEWIPFASRDWASQRCEVRIGAAAPMEFRGSYGLGDPAWLLPIWLRHGTRQGATVPAGTVVTTGTWCGMLPAQAGDLVVVRFDGIGEARVQL